MPAFSENLAIAAESIRTHKLRAVLTVLGLTMGVATLITVMTIVQGANLYIEQKVANLGTNVFQIGRMPFAVMDFKALTKAARVPEPSSRSTQLPADRSCSVSFFRVAHG